MELTSKWLINILKVLASRLQQSVDPFAICLSKSPLKHGFLDINLTFFFGAAISEKTSAMTVIFFWQMFRI